MQWRLPETLVQLLGPARSARTQRITDLALVLVVLLLGLPAVLESRLSAETRTVCALLVVGLAAPLLIRRRRPTAVFATVAVVAFLQWLYGVRLLSDVALLVALYTVSQQQSWRRSAAVSVVLEAGIVMAALRWAPSRLQPFTIALLTGTAAAAFFVGVTMRTGRAHLEGLEERTQRLEYERDQQAQLAAAAERARIARDMHDIVAHNLAVMTALADGAALTAPEDTERAVTAMQQVSATGRQALTEMRRLLGVLRDDRPAALQPQPGLADLDALLGQLRMVGLRTELTADIGDTTLPAGLQLIVFRLVQEAVTNILKHAEGASTAGVRLDVRDGRLEVDVRDDGRARASEIPWGHGIVGMQERALLYGGTVVAQPSPAGGWQVHGSFDLAAARVDA